MDFRLDETAVLIAAQVRKALRPYGEAASSSDVWRTLTMLGIAEIDLSTSEGMLQALAVSECLGEFNAALSLGDYLVADGVLRSSLDETCRRLAERPNGEPPIVGIGYSLGDTSGVVNRLVPNPGHYLIAHVGHGWLLIPSIHISLLSAGQWSPEQPVTIIQWPASAARVVLEDRWEWQARNLVLHTADLVGTIKAMLGRTIDYTKLRMQFDRAIGSFQAIQHSIADDFTNTLACEAIVEYAAWCLVQSSADWELRRAWTHAARALAGETATRVVRDTIQFHGGMSLTAEFWVHRWARRAITLSVYMGRAEKHYEMVGETISRGQELRVALV